METEALLKEQCRLYRKLEGERDTKVYDKHELEELRIESIQIQLDKLEEINYFMRKSIASDWVNKYKVGVREVLHIVKGMTELTYTEPQGDYLADRYHTILNRGTNMLTKAIKVKLKERISFLCKSPSKELGCPVKSYYQYTWVNSILTKILQQYHSTIHIKINLYENKVLFKALSTIAAKYNTRIHLHYHDEISKELHELITSV